MKPILFNTEMVKALLADRKTATRRVVKPQPDSECRHGGQHEFIRDDFIEGSSFTGFVCKKCGYGVCGPHFKFPVGTSWMRPPYHPGDILYVRETWTKLVGSYLYKADQKEGMKNPGKWFPSIHMPKEAARIFLRVTDVRVERLQDISGGDLLKEGIDLFQSNFVKVAFNEFENLWNSTLKPKDRALYGWEANPWVFVIMFERISKDEALQ